MDVERRNGCDAPAPRRAANRARRTWDIRARRTWDLCRAHSFSFAGQASVSLTSFLTTVLLLRYSAPGQLGVYATGASVLIVLLQCVDPLFGRPFTVLRFRHLHEDTAFAGGALSMCVAFSLLASAPIFALPAVVEVGEAGRYSQFCASVAVATPFWVARGFLRAFSLSKGRFREYLGLDTLSSGLQMSCVLAFAIAGRLDATVAMYSVALGSAASTTLAFWSLRGEFTFVTRGRVAQAREFWSFGKWLLVAQAGVAVHMFAAQWSLAAFAGVESVGAYAAYMSIALIPNPFVLAIANLIGATSSNIFAESGPEALGRSALRNAALLALGLSSFLAVLVFLEPDIVGLLYPNLLARREEGIVLLLAAGVLVGSVGLPASNALAAMGRPKEIVVVSLSTACLSVSLAAALTHSYGPYGAACGFVAGAAVGSAGRWLAFQGALAHPMAQAPISTDADADLELVRKLAASAPEFAGLEMKSARVLGIGEQATAYRAEFAAPGGDPGPPLVVKIFRSGRRRSPVLDGESIRRQFFAALRLHAALVNRRSELWLARSPRPFAVVVEPLAILSELAPGSRLDDVLEREWANRWAVRDIARGLLFAVSACWEAGFAHGDLTFDNILCDSPPSESRSVSLIDPGTVESCGVCNGHPARIPRDVADLAHLSSDVACRAHQFVASPIRSLRMLARRRRFAELVVSEHVRGLSDDQRELFRREFKACCRQHVVQMFTLDARLLGPWHALRRRWQLRRFA